MTFILEVILKFFLLCVMSWIGKQLPAGYENGPLLALVAVYFVGIEYRLNQLKK